MSAGAVHPLHFYMSGDRLVPVEAQGNAVTDHLDLPQGTLDLLILKAVSLGPMHGWAISERLHDVTGPPSRFPRARSIPRCTVSSAAADSRRMGRLSDNNRKAKF